ncbi:hypothetical protein X747_28820 [Mesorhizobium sp. LNJC384A00]|nr:hypothetical protein X747_28820 [Mesorhizobium sp. LNJC384A00]
MLAYGSFVLFFLEIVTYIGCAIFMGDMTHVKDAYQLIFPATAGLVGSASGYYFGKGR